LSKVAVVVMSLPSGPHGVTVSLGPHSAYFRRRKFKPQVEKVSTVADKLSFHF